MIAISLLVGNDHDLNGIVGIGLDTAVRFVKYFCEEEILNRFVFLMLVGCVFISKPLEMLYDLFLRLHEVARGDRHAIQGNADSSDVKSPKIKVPHCSHCGHPGNKKAHLKLSCEYCNSTSGRSCLEKPTGFKCSCLTCDLVKLYSSFAIFSQPRC